MPPKSKTAPKAKRKPRTKAASEGIATEEQACPDGYVYQHSSELSKLVRTLEKEQRDQEAKGWRTLRAKDPIMARKVWVAKQKAMNQAISDFWNSDPQDGQPKYGLAKLLSEAV